MGKDQELIQAVKDNDSAAIQKILHKLSKGSKAKIIGNNKKFNINFQDGDGMSALHQAALMGITDVIKVLLEHGASSDLKDNKGMVALHYAAWQGKPEPVQALLMKQAPVNEQALNGETPLHLASQHGHIHVVKLLLAHHADPTVCSKELKTPLDLACEFGRYRVAEMLLKSNLCQKLLEDNPTDTLDNGRTTCLHLASKNGHSDIIRLLIQNGMNINRATLKGTCLHEASLYGKTDVVKLLVDCGIDVNKPDSYDQTALDIVNKFTTTRAARELKQLLKEASFAVQARAVKDYFNQYDTQALCFKEGDIITVLEQRGDGLWKGYVVGPEGRMAKTGLFPANHVVLVDGQALKQQQQSMKGGPVPDLLNRGPYYNHNGHLPNGYGPGVGGGGGGDSLSSSSTDDSYPSPPHVTAALGTTPVTPGYVIGVGGDIYVVGGGGGGGGGVGPPPASPGGLGPSGPLSPAHHSALHSPALAGYGALPGSPSHYQQPLHAVRGSGPPHSPALHSGIAPHSPAHHSGISPHSAALHSGIAPHSPALHHGIGPHSPAHGPNTLGVLHGPVINSSSPGYKQTGSATAFPFGPHLKDIQDISNGCPPFSPQHTQASGSKAAVILPGGASVEQYGVGGGGGGGEWPGGPMASAGAAGVGDMRGCSPSRDHQAHHPHHNHSPAHSNRNSAASSDSGRGVSTGHLEPKVVTVIGQHRLSGQSYESGVSSRQSYHSTSSSSLGSLDRLDESSHPTTINVHQLIQAGVPDKEVLHAWLHDLHFEDYFSNFAQAGYDMPTISRMTPEDLTAIGITKPNHRKRLKSEIARLHIHDGIPDFCPHDLIEWLHLLGLGMYHETLTSQGYDNIEYVTDITWEDLEEIGIKKLGHQKKIMLAIDRLKRITSASKRLSTVETRRASIEMLEPPPPAPPIGRWSGEISFLPPHMFEGGLGVGAKPKKSPSGDSISTTGSGGSGSSHGSSSGGGADVRVIPLPRDDAGMVGSIPYNRQASQASGGFSDVISVQVKRQGSRSSASEDGHLDQLAQPVVYQSFQGTMDMVSEFTTPVHPMSTSDPGTGLQLAPKVSPKPKPMAKMVATTRRMSRDCSPEHAEMEKHESENNSDGGSKAGTVISSGAVAAVAAMMERSGELYTGGTLKRGTSSVGQLKVETHSDNAHEQPQVSPKAGNAPSSPKPSVLPKPVSPLHVATHHNPTAQSSGSPTGRNKKAPPPPPKRTHSIRSDAAPAQILSKVEHANFSVTTTATVVPALGVAPSSNIVKAVSNPVSTPVTSSNMVKAANNPVSGPPNGNSMAKAVNNPVNSPAISSNMVKAASNPVSSPAMPTKQQSPATPAKIVPPAPAATPKLEPPEKLQTQPQPQSTNQTQAFASCVKSLSERFGSKNSETEGSQESLSSDSDDFPPPPPPIAMDIITPKIHNYGIPSRSDIHHPPPTVRDYNIHGGHHHHPAALHAHTRDYAYQNRPKPGPDIASHKPEQQQNLLAAAMPQMKRISPGRDVPATSMTPASVVVTERGKSADTQVPLPSLDKRSESTTSFESTTSSSSTDSNTLPFANENVGTIKQRAVAIKPSVVQTFDSGDGQRNFDINSSVFESSSSVQDNSSVSSGGSTVSSSSDVHRTNSSSTNSDSGFTEQPTTNASISNPGHRRTESVSGASVRSSNSVANPPARPGVPQNSNPQSAVSRLNVTAPAPASLAQLSQHSHNDGPHRPPVPGKKPTHMPIPPQPLQQRHHQQPQSPPQLRQQSHHHHQQQQRPSSSQLQAQQQQQQLQAQQQQQKQPSEQPALVPLTTATEPTTNPDSVEPASQGNSVLSDIDDMLQGLTDELDAMLLEEGVS